MTELTDDLVTHKVGIHVQNGDVVLVFDRPVSALAMEPKQSVEVGKFIEKLGLELDSGLRIPDAVVLPESFVPKMRNRIRHVVNSLYNQKVKPEYAAAQVGDVVMAMLAEHLSFESFSHGKIRH